MFNKEFTFGTEIKKDTYYSPSQGYGIINFDNVEGDTMAKKALLAGGWNLRATDKGAWKTSYENTNSGVKISTPRHVLVFKSDVDEYGTYKITLRVAPRDYDIKSMTIFAGRRNLIARGVEIKANSNYEISFLTYATPYIPAITSEVLEDKAVYISVLGENATISSINIEKVSAKTIFIAGDSTLTDQNALTPYYPIGSCCGWAQDLSAFVKNIAVCNYAHSGLTTNCFKDDGHWDILKSMIKPGDIFMIQFGHNDQKRRNLAAFGGYYNNLKWYVARVRELGAFPIICSPISRVPFLDDGLYRSLLSAHALACQKAAEEVGTPFIDLHTLTMNKWIEIGLENISDYFIPGDITHTDDYGAKIIAEMVATNLSNIDETAEFIAKTSLEIFSPDSDTRELPTEPAPEKGMFDIVPPYVDMPGIKKYDSCADAFKKGLMDPCVMHIHPTEPMPRAQLLMIYLRALRLNGERPYLGKYCDIAKYEWDSSYVQTCIRENLIDETATENGYFRPDEPLTYGEFASFLIRGLEPDAHRRDVPMDLCFSKSKELGLIDSDVNKDSIIPRQDVYSGLAILMDLLDNSDKDMPSDAEIHPVG